MKKNLLLMIALMLCFGLFGCQKPQDEPQADDDLAQMANPFVEVSIEEFNEFGIPMEAFEGSTNRVYYLVNQEYAQIIFEVNEVEYTFRGSKNTNYQDLCGLYGDLLASNRMGKASYYKLVDKENGNIALATWEVEDVTYTITTYGDENTLAELVEAYLK